MKKEVLLELVNKKLSTREISKITGKSQTTVRYWLAKYCIKTKPSHGLSTTLTLKCKVCGRSYVYDKQKGHLYSTCNSCVVNKRRFKLKEKSVEYKGGSCIRCGYHRNVRALEFHHRDATGKDFSISGAHSRKWESIQNELDKCDMLCANCHREVHAEIDDKDS